MSKFLRVKPPHWLRLRDLLPLTKRRKRGYSSGKGTLFSEHTAKKIADGVPKRSELTRDDLRARPQEPCVDEKLLAMDLKKGGEGEMEEFEGAVGG